MSLYLVATRNESCDVQNEALHSQSALSTP